MPALLPTIAPYVPASLVRAVLEHPDPISEPISKRFPAAVLFADVSGFTSLTEALSKESAEGPEELTRLLNAFFGRMVALIEAEGAEVVKFGGDALTALFAGEPLPCATRRAVQTAERMQAAMVEFSDLRASIGPVSLGLKIGVGAGEIVTIQVKGVPCRYEYVVAGSALKGALCAEREARSGEIGLSPEARSVIHGGELRSRAAESLVWSATRDVGAAEAILRCYLPRPIRGWLQQDLHDWAAVLHPMSVLFLGVRGLDYDRPESVAQLGTLFSTALEIVYRYEGTLARLSVEGKETVMLVLFGAPPFAHENDPLRAVRCALDVRSAVETQSDPGLQLAVGVATGRVYAGPVGADSRREYTVMGDAVNLAARLMKGARGGEIHCGYATFMGACSACQFRSVSAMRIRGRAGLIRVYEPILLQESVGAVRAELAAMGHQESRGGSPLVGRQAEVARLEEALDRVVAGQNQVLVIEGEAGIGKSRLVIELARLLHERGIIGLLGTGRSLEQQTPYRAWRDVFESYLGLDSIVDPDGRRASAQRIVSEIAPDQVAFTSLLNDVLNLGLPESEAVVVLDPALRQQRLTALLLSLLRAWAQERPLVLVFEDAHWLDGLSWELAIRAAHLSTDARTPVSTLLVLVIRPLDAHSLGDRYLETLRTLPIAETISLETLLPEEAVALVTARLGLPQGGLPEPIAELVRTHAGGNPFFAEELVLALRDQGLIRVTRSKGGDGSKAQCKIADGFAEASQSLPDTVQGVILSRIGRLTPEHQLTLKVASVIGRTFAYRTLRRTFEQYAPITDAVLQDRLDALASLDLTPLNSPVPELTYIFKHIITREVAYESLLFAQRRALHRTVAEALEELYSNRTAALVGLLAHHWDQANVPEKAIGYLLQAGGQAQKVYANAEAIAHFGRALDLVVECDGRGCAAEQVPAWRFAAQRGLGQVYFGIGELENANRLFKEAIAFGRGSGLDRRDLLRLYHWLGEVLWWQAERDDHLEMAKEALALLGDETGTVEAALINQAAATGYLGQGDRDRFREFTLRTAQFIQELPYSEVLRPAYAHIVIVHRDAGDFDRAMAWLGALEARAGLHHDLRALGEVHLFAADTLTQTGWLGKGIARWKQAVEVFGQIEDVKHESYCYPKLAEALIAAGDLENARPCAQRGIETSKAVDVWDHLQLAYRDVGQLALCERSFAEAIGAFGQCVRLAREHGEAVREAWATSDLGRAYLAQGDDDQAAKQFETALDLAGREGLERSPWQFAAALNGLEQALDRDAFRAACRSLQRNAGRGDLVAWYLEPVDAAGVVRKGVLGQESSSAGCFADSVSPAWSWHDPLGDCSYHVGNGLEIRAANGRDLTDANQSAPRMQRPVSGDFIVQVTCVPALTDRPVIGGIVLWKGKEYFLRLDRGTRGSFEVSFGGCLEGRNVVVGRGLLAADGTDGLDGRVFLRLERVGDGVRALCSADGEAWFSVGSVAFSVDGRVDVALCSIGVIDRMVYPAAYPDGTAIRFESCRLWEV